MASVLNDVQHFLADNVVATIATVHERLPFNSPVHFVADEELNLYFETTAGTDKYLNLMVNPNVAIVVGSSPKHSTVQARGQAQYVDATERGVVQSWLQQKREKHGVDFWPPHKIVDMQGRKNKKAERVVFRVTPQQLTFINLADRSYPASISDQVHKIIPGNL